MVKKKKTKKVKSLLYSAEMIKLGIGDASRTTYDILISNKVSKLKVSVYRYVYKKFSEFYAVSEPVHGRWTKEKYHYMTFILSDNELGLPRFVVMVTIKPSIEV